MHAAEYDGVPNTGTPVSGSSMAGHDDFGDTTVVGISAS
jgi:hypothetical protein